mmetsp:Transcript_60004/g.147554  ORF Transcript_60004/g.147554 Transcript_60004/m.147554 type:complete len:230 (-) Transcript_60004:1042-1731(-)
MPTADDPPSVGPDHTERVRAARLCVLERVVEPNGRVNGVLRHLAVRGPLSPADRHQPAVHKVHHVPSRQPLCVPRGRFGVSDEGAQACPGREHVLWLQGGVENAVALSDDEVDLFWGAGWLLCDLHLKVSSASQGASLPRKQIQHPSILSKPNAPHALGRVLAGEHHVRTLRRNYDRLGRRIRHLAKLVSKGPCCIDDLLRLDLNHLPCEGLSDGCARNTVPCLPRLAL